MRLIKIVLALAVLAAIVIGIFAWTLPADVGYRYGSRYFGPLVLSGIRGTIWDGHADGVSLFGNDLGELDWHARKQPLLHGDFVADVRIKGAEIELAGLMTRHDDGAISAQGLRFSVPASMLEPMFEAGNVHLLGTISGVLEDATLWTASLRDATGNARWSEAGVTGGVEARFTDMLAEFASQPDGTVAGKVHDDGQGNLAIDGRFALRLPMFDGEATLSARNADPQVLETLRHVGEPQPDGSTRVVVHGRTLKVL
jgi:general secretion pathway protein N